MLDSCDQQTDVNFNGDWSYDEFTHAVVSTFALLQAIETKSFICSSLHCSIEKSVYNQIDRYCERGFIFLEPELVKTSNYSEIIVKKVFKTRKLLKDDKELQNITIIHESNQTKMCS